MKRHTTMLAVLITASPLILMAFDVKDDVTRAIDEKHANFTELARTI